MGNQNISISTELMKNYKQTELMSPEKKFEALQTGTGASLLFSIGTDNVFYVTTESVGHSTGWQKKDLSSAQIAASFPGKTGLTCKTFEVAQSVVDGTIGMAMVINDGTNDHLFLSLENSDSKIKWINKPSWVQYPFDNPTKEVIIDNVLISETINKTQYIVVDIERDPSSAQNLISRYYIDTTNPKGPAWMPHDVTADIEASKYTSCLGRQYLPNSPHQPTIDGLYTSGQIDGTEQLVFQPLYNVFDPTVPASSARLNLPKNLIADTIASCRKKDHSTDLYACSQGGLYYFASSNQTDGSTAVLLDSNIMYNGVKKMYARQHNTTVIVWGLNGNDEIFYTTCTVGKETSSPWTYPLPIVTGVDLFSPYINKLDGQNTFFAGAGNLMQKLIKSNVDTTWLSQSITLPSLDSNNTQKYSSYTTRIHVTDDNGQQIVDSPITITAASRTPVYINHLYYIIDPIGVQINTDQLGSITVVEWVDDLNGTKLNVSGTDKVVTTVDPMVKPFTKLSSLNSTKSLKTAVITNDDGSTQPFISSNTSSADLTSVAQSNKQLGKAYTKLNSSSPTSDLRLMKGHQVSSTRLSRGLAAKASKGILVDIGDLFRWIKSGVEAVIHVIEDVANGIWHFIAKIAGKIYRGIIKIAKQVVAAIVWIYNAIKTVIEDIIKFVEFLFGWQDILTTHTVMKNVFIQVAKNSIANVSTYKTDLTAAFKALQNDVDKWADIPNFDQTPADTTKKKPPKGQNGSPAHLGTHHFQGNAKNAKSNFTPASVTESIFDDLLKLLDSEGKTIQGAANAIKTDIIDQFNSLTLTEIIKKFIAIVVDTLLQTAENILLAALDVFEQLASGMVELMTKTIDIPVISWLYKKLTGDDLSVLDLICLIAAIPATIIYKIAADKAPFAKDDPFTSDLIGATDYSSLQKCFYATSNSKTSARMLKSTDASPVLDGAKLKTFAFTADIFALAGGIVLVVSVSIQRTIQSAGVASKGLALISAIGNVAYILPNIAGVINSRTSNWYQQLNNVFTEISFLKGFADIPIAVADNEKWGIGSAFVESALNLMWNIPVIMNIVDNKVSYNTTYKSLIPESIGNFLFNLGGIMEFPIALTKNDEVKVVEMGVQYVLMVAYGGSMIIAGGIYAFAKDQTNDGS